MPKLIGALRTKDDDFFLKKTINEICKICHELAIIDDYSNDNSIETISQICYSKKTPYRVIKSPDERFHEGRDKDLLLNLVYEMKAEWCLAFDSDEVYEQDFVKEIPQYLKSSFDVIWVGATQLWSLEEKLWYEVDTFRVDSGWTTSFLEDGTGIQHNRPALFKVFPQLKKSGSLRDHGYLCPKELWDSNNCLFSKKIFAHFGYAIPSLVEKKCIRHGNIPAVTDEEVNGANYEPGWKPIDFNNEAAIKEFKRVWLDSKNVELKKLKRKIWS